MTPKEGSSPLSRGIPLPARGVIQRIGIIPALAGNTDGGAGVGWDWSDHPRSRGEYFSIQPGGVIQDGSSPLSRGILASEQA